MKQETKCFTRLLLFLPEEHVKLAKLGLRLQHPASQFELALDGLSFCALRVGIFELVPGGLRYNICLLCTEDLHALAQRRTSYLIGRCVDLSKAYKQVAMATEFLKHGVLGYRNDKGDWRIFATQSLPFLGPVTQFCFQLSVRSNLALLVHGLHMLTGFFCDDSPYLLSSRAPDGPDCEGAGHIFNILGWRHAVRGKKAIDFSLEMQALGIQPNLGSLWRSESTVQNKPQRRDRIKSLSAELRGLGSGARSAAASLAGILSSCSGFVLGHALKPAAHALSWWAMGDNLSRAATHGMCDLIEFLVDASKPQRITTDRDLSSITVYTDGALEARGGSCGALVMNPATSSKEVYGGWAPKLLLEFWWNTGGEQIICEVGVYAYLCVKLACRQGWIARCGICFIDHEACRLGLIKRRSPPTAMFCFCLQYP